MKLNQETVIVGDHILMVPYQKQHVLKYHKWMQNEELQVLTASEPLTLAEEYEMQQSWAQDEDKCTFIVLDRQKFYQTRDQIDSMIGDVNLFISEDNTGEMNVMIAETEARGKGLGKEAIVHMIVYGSEVLKITKVIVKISTDNTRSINLFYRLGFTMESESAVFQEITLQKYVDNEWFKWIRSEMKQIPRYD